MNKETNGHLYILNDNIVRIAEVSQVRSQTADLDLG